MAKTPIIPGKPHRLGTAATTEGVRGEMGTKTVAGRCERHPYEAADTRCWRCGYLFCTSCLSRPQGTRFGPYCVRCALALCGVGLRRPTAPALR